VNQDPLGVAGDLIWKLGPNEVWAGPLADGSRVVVLFNRHVINTQYPMQNITVNWTMIGYPNDTEATVRDLYWHKDLGTFKGQFVGLADIHGCMALKITPVDLRSHSEYKDWRPWQVIAQAQGSSVSSSSSGMSRLLWILLPLAACIFFIFGYFLARAYYKQHIQYQPLSDPRENLIQHRQEYA